MAVEFYTKVKNPLPRLKPNDFPLNLFKSLSLLVLRDEVRKKRSDRPSCRFFLSGISRKGKRKLRKIIRITYNPMINFITTTVCNPLKLHRPPKCVAADVAYDAIESMIVTLQLKPGAPICRIRIN